jgi:hypothetical protein
MHLSILKGYLKEDKGVGDLITVSVFFTSVHGRGLLPYKEIFAEKTYCSLEYVEQLFEYRV